MVLIGDNIRKLREKKNLTQIQVGKICGVSSKAISRYENNQAEPDLGLILQLSKLYDVDYNHLLGYRKTVKDEDNKNKSILDIEIQKLLKQCNKTEKVFVKQILNYIVNSNYDPIDDEALGYIHEK